MIFANIGYLSAFEVRFIKVVLAEKQIIFFNMILLLFTKYIYS